MGNHRDLLSVDGVPIFFRTEAHAGYFIEEYWRRYGGDMDIRIIPVRRVA